MRYFRAVCFTKRNIYDTIIISRILNCEFLPDYGERPQKSDGAVYRSEKGYLYGGRSF